MQIIEIKHKFYYKKINISQIIKKKIACNTCIYIDTFKIKHNFNHKNINN